MDFKDKDKANRKKLRSVLNTLNELKIQHEEYSNRVNEYSNFITPLFAEIKKQKESGKEIVLTKNYTVTVNGNQLHHKKGSKKDELIRVLNLVEPELQKTGDLLKELDKKIEGRAKRIETLTGIKREEFIDE